MQVSIDTIFEYLSWNNSEEIQKQGIELASHIKNLSVLIMPIENKSIWENCAKVLISKSDEELQMYFIELFEWLKDMNWPGASLIYDRLICVSREHFLPAYRYSLSIAKQTQDHTWEQVLNHLFAEYIYNLLDRKKPSEVRLEVICLAKEINDLSLLIKPTAAPYIWECCAQILFEKSDLILEPYLHKLLQWIQDLNWPGAMIILDRLKVFSGEKLKNPFIDRFNYAISLNNEEGLKLLDNLSELLDNESLKAELPKEITEKLQEHYQN